MREFLLFLYAVSVLVYLMGFKGVNTELVKLYKKYDIKLPEHTLWQSACRWLFICLISFIPGLRLLLISIVLIGYTTKKAEFELQNGEQM